MADKLWFKIGEAAAAVGATPAEIRYWEKKIPEVRPRRSKGNLRYYHRDDLPRLRAIHQWIKSGFSAADCRELLLKGCVEHGLGLGPGDAGGPGAGPETGQTGEGAHKNTGTAPEPPPLPWLESVIDALKEILGRLERPLP